MKEDVDLFRREGVPFGAQVRVGQRIDGHTVARGALERPSEIQTGNRGHGAELTELARERLPGFPSLQRAAWWNLNDVPIDPKLDWNKNQEQSDPVVTCEADPRLEAGLRFCPTFFLVIRMSRTVTIVSVVATARSPINRELRLRTMATAHGPRYVVINATANI